LREQSRKEKEYERIRKKKEEELVAEKKKDSMSAVAKWYYSAGFWSVIVSHIFAYKCRRSAVSA